MVHDYNRVLGHSRYVAELAERFAAVMTCTCSPIASKGCRPVSPRITCRPLRFSALATIFSFVLPASLMIGRGFDIVHAQGLTVLSPDIVTAHISNARWLEGRRLARRTEPVVA